MHIEKVISQHRRDLTVIYKCEHCGQTHEDYAYDDENFHRNVVPNMKCNTKTGGCGKAANPEQYRGLLPKYSAGEVV